MKKNENPNTLKFMVISKKPRKATRKVTLSSNESERKGQIGINPLNKLETRAKRIRSKEFYCLASQGMQDLNISIDLRNYKFINYFVRKESENNFCVDSVCCSKCSCDSWSVYSLGIFGEIGHL